MPALHPVTLVGAGPGDPELLTLKAVRVIREATVILVDDLVGEQVLASVLAGVVPPPRVVNVGKRGGCASTPQAFIERLLVREAQAGEKVVRLKGGDPLVFGRAGEEMAALREAGIEVQVVNGITSGLAAAQALGTGWTDRRWAQGVILVTGHAQAGHDGPDWDSIGAAAARGLTLVVYMGLSRVEQIVQALRRHVPGDWPAAVVQGASTATQRQALTTLERLPALIETEGFRSPAVLVMGRVLEASALAQAESLLSQGPARAAG
ncbi:uroporphyrinogen-III C-methyltransferase [Ideonella sp. DXS29W]|uniref:uroporphyrinogen-III C-methyltransferase n=1 Tax=Ideonella lacteola TaxID=2984193 RepID=A0ABU9BKL3_9BURK